MFKPKGVIVPLITPMHEDESINEEALRAQINRQIEAGIYGIFVLGTNGEFYAMSESEKLSVIKIAVEETRGRVPVYAGTGCVGTKETVELSKKAKDLGADVLSIICPYFAGLNQDEIFRHFTTVAKAVDLPILLYNMPARTGNNITFKTIRRLAEANENIIGAKDSSGNFDNILRYIEETGGRMQILSGNDSLILWTLMAGGVGAIAGWSNAFPKLMCSIYNYWAKGDIESANKAQKTIRPFRDVMAMGNPNTVVKRAMNLLGYKVGPARAPASGDDPKIDEALKAALEGYRE